MFRKILERCLYRFLVDNSPPLDIAQGGLRKARGSLDQAICLAEICNILRRHLSNSINKALVTMNQLSSIGLNPKGFNTLLATRFYTQIVRAQLEYGLAINKITSFLAKKLENAQSICIHRIFGGSSQSSVKVILHLTKLPTMQEHPYILHAQFLLQSLTLPDDILLTCLLPYIRCSDSHSRWYKLSKSPLRTQYLPQLKLLDKRTLKKIQLQFRRDNLN